MEPELNSREPEEWEDVGGEGTIAPFDSIGCYFEPEPLPHAWLFALPLIIWIAVFFVRRRITLRLLFGLIFMYALLFAAYGTIVELIQGAH